MKSTKHFVPTKINDHTMLTQQLTHTPYNWPVFLAASYLNIRYMSSYALISICNQGSHSNAYNIVLNLKWLYYLVS